MWRAGGFCCEYRGPSLRTAGEPAQRATTGAAMNNIIWIIGAVVVVIAILSFFGLR